MINLNNLELNSMIVSNLLQNKLQKITGKVFNQNKDILIMNFETDSFSDYVSPATEYYDNEDNQISDLVSLRTVVQALDNLGIEVGVRELVYAIDEIEDEFPFECLRENQESSYEH